MGPIPSGSALIDGRFGVIQVGSEWERYTGIRREDAIGTSVVGWVHPADAAELARLRDSAALLRIGTPRDWRTMWVRLGRWREGRAVLRIRVVRDATERRHAPATRVRPAAYLL